MEKESKDFHNCARTFNPDVTLLECAYQDFFDEIQRFNAGKKYISFNDFIKKDAAEYRDMGEGVTYVVFDVQYDKEGKEIHRECIAYYTLSAISIPYEDRIRLDKEEAQETGREFDIQICGIPAIEIKMFAVDEKYQDVFYQYRDEKLPISAWIMRNIINYANSLLENVIGVKALFLHSVPEAEAFYVKNGFHFVEKNMKPLHCIDSEFTAMYLTLREVHMNYDD